MANQGFLNIDPPDLFQIDLLSPLKDFVSWLITQGIPLMLNLAYSLTSQAVENMVSALGWVWDRVGDIVGSGVMTIVNFFMGQAPITPDKAVGITGKLMTTSFAVGVSVAGLLTALDVKVAGTGLEMKHLSRLVYRLLQIGIAPAILISTITAIAYKRPLEYWANNMFRSRLPDYRQAWSMFCKGIITEESLNYIFRYQAGFSEDWIKAIKKDLTYTPSPWEIMRLADYTSLEPFWVLKKLSDVGMDEWDKQYFLQAIIKRPLREEVKDLVYEIGTQYIYGWLSEEDTRKMLLQAGIKPEEVELTMSRIILVRKRTLLSDKVDILRQQFRKDLIDVQTLELKLKELGLAEENVNNIVAYEKALKGLVN